MKFNSVIYLLRSALTLGGDQQFLGARWISVALKIFPNRNFAERLLSFSPHYFYGRGFWLSKKELASEVSRNQESRSQLMKDFLDPYLRGEMAVVDYGCGPGFLAYNVSKRVAKVFAVDVSSGLLACARIINPGSTRIEYKNIADGAPMGHCDLAYSFAVFQHLTSESALRAACYLNSSLKTGGKVVIHIVVDAEGWEPETEVDGIALKVKRKYGLNCFSRTEKYYRDLFGSQGFGDISIQPAIKFTEVNDDIRGQHILTATKS